jgi:hypothetical protein
MASRTLRRKSVKRTARKGTRKATRKGLRKATRKNGGGKTVGGKKGGNKWNKFVMGVYNEMKRKNPDVAFGDALKEASRLKKKGEY